MQRLFHITDASGLLSLGVLACVVLYVGRQVVGHRVRWWRFGLRMGAFASFAYLLRGWHLWQPDLASDVTAVVVRSIVVGAVVAAFAWIMGTGCDIVVRSVCGVGKRIAYRWSRTEAHDWSTGTFAEPVNWEDVESTGDLVSGESATGACDQQEREQARLACDLVFERFAVECGPRFTRERYNEMANKYLSDDLDIDTFTHRSAQLEQLIRQQAAAVSPAVRFQSLTDLMSWYQQQRAIIAALEIEQIFKDDLLIQLHERYAEFAERLVGEPT